METHSDQALLAKYVADRSGAAFAEIVRRNVGIVYSSALRQVRDPHMADDVTQAVFLILSQRAAKIRPGTVLSAWLWTAARFAAKDALKMERRRKAREGRAGVALLQAARDASADPHRVPLGGVEPRADALGGEWNSISPVLDGAMGRLGESARTAVVLRFFEGKSFKEVGVRLGITEDAAKQRVFRGLQRLRQAIGRRGDAGTFLSVDAIAMGMVAHAVTAAPPAVTAAAISVAGKASLAATAHVALAKGAVSLMNGAKIKALTAVAAMIVVGGAGAVATNILPSSFNRPTPPVAAPQPLAFVPDAGGAYTLKTGGKASPQFGPSFMLPSPVAPYAGPPIVGSVHDANGGPVVGAEVFCSTIKNQVILQGEQEAGTPRTRTDALGHFEIMPPFEPKAIVVRSDLGFGVVPVENVQRLPTLALTPWGRLEGTLRKGTVVSANTFVELDRMWSGTDFQVFNIYQTNTTYTAPEGSYIFDRVVPGNYWVTERSQRYGTTLRRSRAFVPGGRTAHVDLGGSGHVVTGRVVLSKPLDGEAGKFRYEGNLVPLIDPLPAPVKWATLRPAEREAFNLKQQQRGAMETTGTFGFDVNPADGTFHIDDVPAGKYQLRARIGLIEPGSWLVEDVGYQETTVTISGASAGGGSTPPVDLGVLKITPYARLTRGRPVPPIQVQRADGSTLRLSDFHGKYVLLHFWGRSAKDPVADLEDLKVIYDRFGDETEHFAMVGIYMDGDHAAATEYLKARNINWTQGFAGPNGWKTLPQEYFRSPSFTFLIDQAGNLVAKNISGRGAWAEVDRVMGGRGGVK